MIVLCIYFVSLFLLRSEDGDDEDEDLNDPSLSQETHSGNMEVSQLQPSNMEASQLQPCNIYGGKLVTSR